MSTVIVDIHRLPAPESNEGNILDILNNIAVELFTPEQDFNKLLEEIEELICALGNFNCTGNECHKQELLLELADVYIMMHRFMFRNIIGIFDLNDAVHKKALRTLERFKSGYYKTKGELIEIC